jgi:hypothetical protein
MNYTDYTNTEAFTSMNFQESIFQLINNKIASCDMAWTTLVNYLQGECGFSEMVIFLGTVFFHSWCCFSRFKYYLYPHYKYRIS